MSSELHLHAYIFAGNALNLLVNGFSVDLNTQLGASRETLLELRRVVEPLTPANILTYVAELPSPQRQLLQQCCRWCIANLGADFDALMGLSRKEASTVLEAL